MLGIIIVALFAMLILCCISSFVGGVFFTSSNTNNNANTVSNGQIKNMGSEKCLQFYSMGGGAYMDESCNVDHINDGYSNVLTYNPNQTISNNVPGKTQKTTCLAQNNSDGNNTRVFGWECLNSDDFQKWEYDTSTGLLKNKKTGYCLDGTNGQVVASLCDKNVKGQQWTSKTNNQFLTRI